MMPASTKAGGQCVAFPDVCDTPTPAGTVPFPYANIGLVNQATSTSSKVKFKGKKVVIRKSVIPRSRGDEAGTAGGVVSKVIMNKIRFKKCSSKVKVEGQPIAHLTSMTGHNGMNANMPAGCQVAPSQTKVLVGM